MLVEVRRGHETRRITLETTRSAAAAGIRLEPGAAVSRYLDDEEPPGHLLVAAEGVYPSQL